MPRKDALYERDLGRCRYCGIMLEPWQATVDHVIPKKEGGRSTNLNIVTACPLCNAGKSDRTLEEANMRLWSIEEFEVLLDTQKPADAQRAREFTESQGGAHGQDDSHGSLAPALGGDGAHLSSDNQLTPAPIPPLWEQAWPPERKDISVNEFDVLYRDFKQFQRMRIARQNYIRGRNQLGLEVHSRLIESLLIMENLEKQAEKDLELVKIDYLWPAFNELKGISVTLAAGIRGVFDPLAFPNVQKAWKYAGYAVIDGEGQRRKRGQKAGFNTALKTRLWQAADCLWKANPEWRAIGRKYKAKQLWLHRHDGTLGSNGKGIKGHAHNRALRFLAKQLVKYLWCHAHGRPMSKAEL